MQRYFIYLAYNGANYCGWQNQPNGIAVQQKIEETLTLLLRHPVTIVGAGRTDAGVHARKMAAHFDSESLLDESLIVDKLNRILPKDIVIFSLKKVIPEAHARFDALSRTYHYYIATTKDPFDYPFQYRTAHPLDIVRMNEAAAVLFDYIDFTSFSKLHTDVKTNNCRIMKAEWKQVDNLYVFTIQADRFLRNMVRAIVGTLVDVGRGKLSAQDVRRIIEQKDRGKAGTSVPGNALFLTDIEYPEHLFIPDQV